MAHLTRLAPVVTALAGIALMALGLNVRGYGSVCPTDGECVTTSHILPLGWVLIVVGVSLLFVPLLITRLR